MGVGKNAVIAKGMRKTLDVFTPLHGIANPSLSTKAQSMHNYFFFPKQNTLPFSVAITSLSFAIAGEASICPGS